VGILVIFIAKNQVLARPIFIIPNGHIFEQNVSHEKNPPIRVTIKLWKSTQRSIWIRMRPHKN